MIARTVGALFALVTLGAAIACGPRAPASTQGTDAAGANAADAAAAPLTRNEELALQRNVDPVFIASLSPAEVKLLATLALDAAPPGQPRCDVKALDEGKIASIPAQGQFDRRTEMILAGCDFPLWHTNSLKDLTSILWDIGWTSMSANDQLAALMACAPTASNMHRSGGDLIHACFRAGQSVDFDAAIKAVASSEVKKEAKFYRAATLFMQRNLYKKSAPPSEMGAYETLTREWEDKYRTPHKPALDAALAEVLRFAKLRTESSSREPPKDLVAAFKGQAEAPKGPTLPTCSTDHHAAFIEYITSKKPKSAKDVEDAANDPVGQVLLRASLACSVSGNDPLRATFARFLIREGEPWLGAHHYAYIKGARDTGSKVPVLSIWSGLLGVGPLELWTNRRLAYVAHAPIKAVTEKDGNVIVTFKTVAAGTEYVTTNCWNTNRIERITSSGRVEYEEKCEGYERSVTNTEEPIVVPKSFAAGLAPNRVITFVHQLGLTKASAPAGEPRPSFVVRVSEKDKTIAAYGFKLN